MGTDGFAGWARSTIRDPHWVPRGILVALLGWFLVRFLLDPRYVPPFAALNLVVHEAGHALFFWSGNQWWTVAGGTLFELAVPPLVGLLFFRQRDALGVLVALFWLGSALVDVSVYVGDARAQALPLVSMWEGTPIHDWNYLLGRAGGLRYDRPLGRLLRLLGLVCMALAAGGGGWLVAEYRRRAAITRNDEGQPIP
jgi:hypothetical protein